MTNDRWLQNYDKLQEALKATKPENSRVFGVTSNDTFYERFAERTQPPRDTAIIHAPNTIRVDSASTAHNGLTLI